MVNIKKINVPQLNKFLLNPELYSFLLILTIFAITHITVLYKGFVDIDYIFINKYLKYIGITALTVFFIRDFVTGKINYKSPFIFLFFIFIISFVYKLGNYYFSESMVKEYFSHNINILLATGAYFLVGFYFPRKFQLWQKIVVGLFLLLMIISDLRFVNLSYVGLAKSEMVNRDMWGNYLMWADTFAIFSLICIYQLKNKYIRLVVGLSCIMCLMLLISRGALGAFTFAFIVFPIFSKDRKQALITYSLLAVLLCVVFVYLPDLRALALNLPNTLKALGARSDITMEGVKSILSNPISGDFLGQLSNQHEKFNTVGFYIHNYLSIWRQFGIVAFASFIFYYVYVIKYLIIKRTYMELVPLAIYILLVVTLFRAYVFPYFWILAGIIAARAALIVNAETNSN